MKASILLVLSVAMIAAVAKAQDELPRYEPAACPFEGAERRDDVRCGYLEVPEDREHPAGRTLRLAVVVLKSHSDTPRPDPLVYLSGGPGGPAVESSARRLESPFWNRYRQDRDLVFFDQRGTGYSDPKFCPEMDVALYTASFRGLSVAEQRAFEVEAVRSCREQMLAEGIDFRFYNSATSARDLDDIRRALGYDSWNLFGISYGTRLALTAMRDTPGGIRSVTIDSTQPPNAPAADANEKLTRSLRLVFDQCAADANCSTAFPTLEHDFFSMLDDLEANPMVLTMGDADRFPGGRIVVDGTLMAAGAFQGLYDRAFISVFPLFVREVGGRNTDVLTALADGLAQDPSYLSQGLLYAVDCYERIPRDTPEMIRADRSRHPELEVWHEFGDETAICDAWHDARAEASEAEAVYSEIATLVAAGEFDPITPPSYARLAAESLPNSTYIEVPGVGHGAIPFTDCTKDIFEAFLDDPTRPPDTSCVAEIPPASFVTDVHMSPGIYRLAKQIQDGPGLARIAGLGLMVLLLITAVVGWPLGWVVRRIFRRPLARTGGAKAARWLAAATALQALGFCGGLVAVVLQAVGDNPFLLAFGVPGSARALFFLPWLVILPTLGVALLAVVAWKQRWWNTPGRVHYLLVAAACVGFVVWVGMLGLI